MGVGVGGAFPREEAPRARAREREAREREAREAAMRRARGGGSRARADACEATEDDFRPVILEPGRPFGPSDEATKSPYVPVDPL